MINILDKQNCCGCGACVQTCPKNCIVLKEDLEGFLYPEVNLSKCVDCGLCEKVCPELSNPMEERYPTQTLAAKNSVLNVRERSSSGGIFYLLAESVLEKDGVVYGAEFDFDWSVKHNSANDKVGIVRFMGSKYAQSRIGDTFRNAAKTLESGKLVLFVGTPCQIAGLNRFLGKEYDNLISVEVVCHGVPSPKVWKSYLEEVREEHKEYDVENVSFRDKRNGWKKFSLVLSLISSKSSNGKEAAHTPTDSNQIVEYHRENIFMKGFLKNIYLRPSCYSCKFKCGKSGCDIALGDFWGVQNFMPDFDDDKGVSLILIYSTKGAEIIKSLSFDYRNADYKEALKGNPCIEHSVKPHPEREWFYKKFPKMGISAIQKAIDRVKPSLARRIMGEIKGIVSRALSIK
ncbi:MAG: Coenzyme F420 hydrogenase/dehydrogenase, beta subunit C-terminal domain [Bacteroidales bacterium]|nr:Coenzyme F420 hydrogenase/dehydrogenase, beta subunit C-terminal domain [Bacteroidales bacterium]